MTQSVLIVGAGTTGLTAAVELARNGLTPVVIEKRSGPSHLSRAVGILPRSIEILRPSGVAAAISAEAIPFSGVAFHVGPRRIATLPLNFDPASRILGLPQDQTEAHLLDALHRFGSTVQYGTALLAEDKDGYFVARYAAGAQVLAFSERGPRALQSIQQVSQSVLRGALRLAGAVPPLGRAVMRQMAS